MKSNILKSFLFLALSSALLTGCASDDYGIPSIDCVDPNITVTKTVADIKAMATATATQYTEDDVIEAIVVSSDKGGNFYKKIYLTSVDGQIGLSLAINQTKLYLDYQPGRKVYIKLKDLYVQMSSSTLSIGALYNGNVGQLPLTTYRDNIIRSCDVFPEVDLVNEMTLAEAMTDANLGKLIKLKDVQFAASAIGQNYYNPANVLGGETNHIITNNAAETTKLIFRTGSYAEYGSLPVSDKRGTITGILTKFNNDYQFVSRYTSDINLTEARDGEVTPNPTEPTDPTNPTNPTNPTAPTEQGPNAASFFPGGNFADFPAFVAGLSSHGIQGYATQGALGTGFDGGNSLHIQTPGAVGNDYVFTTLLSGSLPANATKISFYVKGTAAKSISMNVYKQGSGYYAFNAEDLSTNKLLTAAATSVGNQYTGTINTNNQWVLVTLDISSLTDLNTTAGTSFFALKIGKTAAYDIYLSNFVIE